MKKSLTCSFFGVSLFIVFSILCLLIIAFVFRHLHYKKSLKALEEKVPLITKELPSYRATFRFEDGSDTDNKSFLTWISETNDVYLVVIWSDLDQKWSSSHDTPFENRNNPKTLSLKNLENEFQITDFNIIHGSLENYGLEPGDIWLVKVTPNLKKYAIPMRLEPLKENEPIWLYGTKIPDWEKEFRLGIVKQIKRNKIRAIIDVEDGLNQYWDTLILDTEGSLVGFRITRSYNTLTSAFYPSPILGTLNTFSIIQEMISDANPESTKTPTVTIIN